MVYGETYTVTAYCPCKICCGKWFSPRPRTASGQVPKDGITCAAPRRIPFGTRLYIQGVGERIVQDRLAKRFDSRIDIFMSNHTNAVRFGIRTNVVVYKKSIQKTRK
jgi:3D (Asp-Asp-Asp) domain-containing protein